MHNDTLLPSQLPAEKASLPASYRPSADQPGTLAEQLQIIDLYLSDPTRRTDPHGSWQMARRLVLEHARRAD